MSALPEHGGGSVAAVENPDRRGTKPVNARPWYLNPVAAGSRRHSRERGNPWQPKKSMAANGYHGSPPSRGRRLRCYVSANAPSRGRRSRRNISALRLRGDDAAARGAPVVHTCGSVPVIKMRDERINSGLLRFARNAVPAGPAACSSIVPDALHARIA